MTSTAPQNPALHANPKCRQPVALGRVCTRCSGGGGAGSLGAAPAPVLGNAPRAEPAAPPAVTLVSVIHQADVAHANYGGALLAAANDYEEWQNAGYFDGQAALLSELSDLIDDPAALQDWLADRTRRFAARAAAIDAIIDSADDADYDQSGTAIAAAATAVAVLRAPNPNDAPPVSDRDVLIAHEALIRAGRHPQSVVTGSEVDQLACIVIDTDLINLDHLSDDELRIAAGLLEEWEGDFDELIDTACALA